MDIVIKGRDVEITPALRDYISTKMLKIQRHGPLSGQPHMTLRSDNRRYLVELSTHLPSDHLQSQSQGTDIHASIDSAIDAMDRKLCKHII